MLKITTLNLNGLRSSYQKGLDLFVKYNAPDIFCVQETRIQICDVLDHFNLGYKTYFNQAQKKGYSGVGIYSKKEPLCVIRDFDGGEFDAEGRCIGLEFEQVVIFSIYFPSGSSGPVRQDAKFRFLDRFLSFVNHWKKKSKSLIFCGDWNIAHQKIDLKNWRSNQKNSGFLPEERAWFSRLLAEKDFVDIFRELHPTQETYTWWSNRGQARQNNVGWRIDYQIASREILSSARRATVDRQFHLSDHAPLCVEYDL